MKKLLTILILISVLLLSCKTKTVTSTKEKESETKEYFSKKDESKNESSKNLQNQEKKIDSVAKSEENEDEFEIAGKVEIDKPFEIQRIENGDTLETFKIIGNADFRFKTKKKTSSGNKNFSETKSSESKQQNASGNSINIESKSKVDIVFILLFIIAVITVMVLDNEVYNSGNCVVTNNETDEQYYVNANSISEIGLNYITFDYAGEKMKFNQYKLKCESQEEK